MTPARSLAACTAVTIAAHALLFLATAAAVGAVTQIDVGAVRWSHEFYFGHASSVMAGQVPYRDFLFEYPILTLPVFLLPRLFTSDLASYRLLFVLEMFLFDAWSILLIARHVAQRVGTAHVPARLGWYTLYTACLGPLVIGRFELAPMALAFAGAHWWFSGQDALGGVATGLGALLKVFPGLVAIPAVVRELSRVRKARPRGTLAFVATCAIGAGCWFALGGGRVWESIRYQTGRSLGIESLYAGLLLLAGKLTGAEPGLVFVNKAYHVGGAWSERLAALSLPIQAAALLLVAWRFARTETADGVHFAGVAVLAFVITGKVFSPQFLIWLLPFVTVINGPSGRQARQTLLVACVCTTLIYPGPEFNLLLGQKLGAIVLLNLRNALLLWLFALLLFAPEGGASKTPQAG